MSEPEQTYSASGEVAMVRTKRSLGQRAWIELSKAPLSAWFGMTVIFLYLFAAVFADVIAPYGEAEIHPQPYAPWSSEFIFGTDQIGRDIYTRLIYGARNTIGIALITTFISFLWRRSCACSGHLSGGLINCSAALLMC